MGMIEIVARLPTNKRTFIIMARKRKPGVARTASGRRSEAAVAYQENVEPILIRMRMFGLTEKDARDQKASTFLGRLHLTKADIVSAAQYDAAIEYARIYERYQRALKSPDALRSSAGAGEGGDSAGYDDWCRAAIDRFDAAMEAIRAEQGIIDNRSYNLYAAMDYIVIRDQEMWHMVGDVRVALNALVHHFGLTAKQWRKQVLTADVE